jgi:hypothetical protein
MCWHASHPDLLVFLLLDKRNFRSSPDTASTNRRYVLFKLFQVHVSPATSNSSVCIQRV